MEAIVAVVLLSVLCTAYEEYKNGDYQRKADYDFDDQDYTENMDDITTTTITTLDETGIIHNRMRRFGEKSSGARTLSLEEIEDVKGALKELLAGRQLDGLTTGTDTIISTVKTIIETMLDKTGHTKDIEFVDRTKFYEDLIEEIINNAKKQGQGNTARFTTPPVFVTRSHAAIEKKAHVISGDEDTEGTSKTNYIKTTHMIVGDEEIHITTKLIDRKTSLYIDGDEDTESTRKTNDIRKTHVIVGDEEAESTTKINDRSTPLKTVGDEDIESKTKTNEKKTTPFIDGDEETDSTTKTKDIKITHNIDDDKEIESITLTIEGDKETTKIYSRANLRYNTNAPKIKFTTEMTPSLTKNTKTLPMQSIHKEVLTLPEALQRKSIPHKAPKRTNNRKTQKAPKRTSNRKSSRVTAQVKKLGQPSKNIMNGFATDKGEKRLWLPSDESDNDDTEFANEFPNAFPANRPFFPGRNTKKKLLRQHSDTNRPFIPERKTKTLLRQGSPTTTSNSTFNATRRPTEITTNTEGELGPDQYDDDDLANKDLFISPRKSSTTTTKRTTALLADPHFYPYPYRDTRSPFSAATNTTSVWRTRRRKTTTTPSTTVSKPHVDVPALLHIIRKLTRDFESNITEMFNETLQTYFIPTCPPRGWRGHVYYDLNLAPVVAKCFVCGLKEEGIPKESFCGDAFATDFLPLVPIDPQAKQHLVRFRKYCRYLDIHNYYENETEPRSVFGRFTGGCSVRFMDLSNIYTQRACRNKRRAMTGKHFASKRMAKLEMALNEIDNGCIISPMASLIPMSRGISLYARFHACVCTGSWCNTAVSNQPWISHLAVTVCWTMLVMILEIWVGHRCWFYKM